MNAANNQPGPGDRNPQRQSRPPRLYMRVGDRLHAAPEDVQEAARRYPLIAEKGAVHGGKRLTILSPRTTFAPNEDIHIIHVLEVVEPGHDVHIMGPKAVYGEYLDGTLFTAPPPADTDPFRPGLYNGATLSSPAIDYNFDVTVYSFPAPGRHDFEWRVGALHSNTLRIEVVENPRGIAAGSDAALPNRG
ncbi:hypothetical protein [Halomonas sp. LBP4]|uniref:hypothetical protein n=1 Tax=Halomonas sp. LBP4 TaxID=2044917 RepID=UPI000D769F52|nr:hypothetical protein [Halomonas sp. LBP4]PXX98168.1 hypothetical protein CR157_07490 [Halomonas sp. LBP4]